MEKTFNIKDYANEGVHVAEIYDCWSNDRCAGGADNAFDLLYPKDFKMFVDMYGVNDAIRYFQDSRLYLDGMNYKSPVPKTADELWKILADELTLDYFREAEEKFGNIDYWGKYVDIEAIKALLHSAPKNRFVIRQYWTGWVDISVEADTLDEAYDLAGEKYNKGDFIPDTEDFENGDMENVTDWYKSNKIPF